MAQPQMPGGSGVRDSVIGRTLYSTMVRRYDGCAHRCAPLAITLACGLALLAPTTASGAREGPVLRPTWGIGDLMIRYQYRAPAVRGLTAVWPSGQIALHSYRPRRERQLACLGPRDAARLRQRLEDAERLREGTHQSQPLAGPPVVLEVLHVQWRSYRYEFLTARFPLWSEGQGPENPVGPVEFRRLAGFLYGLSARYFESQRARPADRADQRCRYRVGPRPTY